MRKYIDLPRKDPHHRLENGWYESCQQRKVPFITVKRRTKYADVHWDYITYPTRLDALLHSFDGALRDKAKEIYLRWANARSSFDGSDQLICKRSINPI